jgi:hypothetical protein
MERGEALGEGDVDVATPTLDFEREATSSSPFRCHSLSYPDASPPYAGFHPAIAAMLRAAATGSAAA